MPVKTISQSPLGAPPKQIGRGRDPRFSSSQSWDQAVFGPHPNAPSFEARKFGICAPELLPDRERAAPERAGLWDDALETLDAEYDYALSPPNLMRALMARVGQKAGLAAHYWRGGFCFYDANTRARGMVEEVRADPKDWAGTIRVRAQLGDASALRLTLCELVEKEAERIGLEARAVRPAEIEHRERDAERRRLGDEPSLREPSAAGRLDVAHEPTDREECFISYAHADDSPEGLARQTAFDRVRERLKNIGLQPAFDAERLGFGLSLSAFMRRMAKSPKAVAIISAKYVRSDYCMAELLHIYRHCRSDDGEFRARVRGVVLPDAGIGSPEERAAIQDYWAKRRNEHEKLQRAGNLPQLDAADYEVIQDLALRSAHLLSLMADARHSAGIDAIDQLTFAA